MPKLTRYWHGGAPGLRVGDVIRPSSTIGVRSATQLAAEFPDYDSDRVYVTNDKAHARAYAANWRHPHPASIEDIAARGDLYNVTPKGDRNDDPDYPTGVSWGCDKAIIVAVIERNVQPTLATHLAGCKYTTWVGGGSMYARDGHMLPSPEMTAMGITAADLIPLGKGHPFGPDVTDYCLRITEHRSQHQGDR